MIFLDAFFFLLPVLLMVCAFDYGVWTLIAGVAVAWLLARFWVLGIGGWGARPGEPGWGVTKVARSVSSEGEPLATVWISFLGVPWLPVRTWSVLKQEWTSLHWLAVLWGAMMMALAVGAGVLVFWVSEPLIYSVASMHLGGWTAFILTQLLPWDVKPWPWIGWLQDPLKGVPAELEPTPPQVAGMDCSSCGEKLILQSEGEVTASGKIVCHACLRSEKRAK